MSILNYKLKWNYYNYKITQSEKQQGWVIYKEIYVNENSFIITKEKLGNRYRCKVWNGKVWSTFAYENTPRKSINRIREYNSEDYSLCA